MKTSVLPTSAVHSEAFLRVRLVVAPCSELLAQNGGISTGCTGFLGSMNGVWTLQGCGMSGRVATSVKRDGSCGQKRLPCSWI